MDLNFDDSQREQELPDEFAATVEALKEALAELEFGDKGQPAEEFFREFRAAWGLSVESPEN